jgi:hypothetical protein
VRCSRLAWSASARHSSSVRQEPVSFAWVGRVGIFPVAQTAVGVAVTLLGLIVGLPNALPLWKSWLMWLWGLLSLSWPDVSFSTGRDYRGSVCGGVE